MRLQIRGKITAGQETLDRAISDLAYVEGAAGPMLVSVSGPEGGLASFSLGQGWIPRLEDTTYFAGSHVSGAGHDVIVSYAGDAARVYVTGVMVDGIVSYTIGSDGDFGTRVNHGGALFGTAPAVGVEMLSGDFVLADPAQPGFAVFGMSGGGLIGTGTVADTDATHADRIGVMAPMRVDGSDIVIVASQSEYGITAYRMDDVAPVAGGSIGPAQGLGIMVPTDLVVTETTRGSFVIVASEPSRGESGALSVMQVDAQGAVTPVDHVLDTRGSRFGNVQHVDAVNHDGHTYVVATGGDRGLTLFELMPNGQLVHLSSVSGTVTHTLDDITALEIAVIGDELQIFVATEGEVGITVLSADVTNRGVALVAADGSGTLSGTGRDDILMDGDGQDRLEGSGGADRYVLTRDGAPDVIAGFDPSQDILDLSGLPFLYDVDTLEIESTSDGAIITHRGETIRLISADNRPLSPGEVRATVELMVNRSFSAPAHDIQGTASDDMIRGDWGTDTLKGMSGNDTLDGGGGRDKVFGGRGDDTLKGGAGNDTINGGAGADFMLGHDGADLVRGHSGNDTLKGGAEADELRGGGGNDRLAGGARDDLLRGGGGRDKFFGGRGDDTLKGGAGNDTINGGAGADFMLGHDGADLVRGRSGNDTLKGGAEADELRGGGGNDRLFGGGHDDLLRGGGGRDKFFGGRGDDTLKGGAGRDTLFGGSSGDDVLTGGNGPDMFRFISSTDSGDDTVTDFENGTDVIRTDGTVTFGDLVITRAGGDTVITWDTGSVTLTGETGLIGEDDFVFG